MNKAETKIVQTMKQNRILSLVALALLAACAKEVNTEDPIAVPAGKEQVTIIAQMPQTRTTADFPGDGSVDFNWQPLEKIAVVEEDASLSLNNLEDAYYSVASAVDGTFTGTKTQGKDLVFAVTPATALVEAADVEGQLQEYSLELPSVYFDYIPGTTNAVMIGVPDGDPVNGPEGDTYKFLFSHATALVKVTYENVPVGTEALVFSTDKNICGLYPGLSAITDVTLGTPVDQQDHDAWNETMLFLSEPVSAPNQTLEFYIPVPVATYTQFSIELWDSESQTIPGTKKTKKNLTLSLEAGDVFVTPTITLEPVEITKGAEWTYEFTSKVFDGNVTKVLAGPEEQSWTLDGDGNYWGNDAAKGQQFGSGGAPYKTMTLTSNFGASYGISDIVINTSGASGISATVSVSVGGTQFVSNEEVSVSLTTTPTDIAFSAPDGNLCVGDIVISYAQTSSKAIFIKTIVVNPDSRIDPELAFDLDKYTAVIGSAFTAPTLTAADGFNGTVAYAVSENDGVASVDATTGEVTIGSNPGIVTITASFAGDDTYKAASASYTLTVGEPFLSVNPTIPLPAKCTEGSTTTFTVTSNVPWSVSTEVDFITVSPSGEQAASADPVTVTVTFAANTSDESRSAVVSVKPTDQETYSSLNEEVTVTQNKFEVVGAIDVLTQSWTGIQGTSYILMNDLHGSASDAVYSVQAAGGNNSIQLRSNNSNSGIVTTTSGGGLKRITVQWNSNTNDDRVLDVYAKNTAYENPTDLYNSSKQGTLVCSFNKSAGNGSFTFEDDYEYIGIRSQSGALYLDEIDIEWISTNWVLGNIAVTTPPTQTEYEVGESFNPDGMVVTATYVDAEDATHTKQQVIPVGDLTFSPALDAALTVDDTDVTITYDGKSTTQAITVILQWDLDHIAVKEGTSVKTSYNAGQSFNPTGLVIVATYKDHADAANEKSVDIPYDANTFTISPDGALTTEDESVTIGYGGKSTTLAITVSEAPAGPSDYSTEYEGNVTLSTSGGSNASSCSVKIGEDSYSGIKAGTGNNAGSVKITVPQNTKYLHLHVAAWNNETVTLSVSPEGYSESILLTSNSGVKGNSPFIFDGNPFTTDYYKVITFSSALSAETELTFTATGGKRFVIWGVTAEE